MRRFPIPALLALLLCGPVRAQSVDLNLLEGWAIEAAPELRLARAQVEIETQRLEVAAARLSPRLSGATGLALSREAVDADTTYGARRITGQVAVRWPLAGPLEAQRRERKEIDAATTRARLQVEQARRDTLRKLRAAYAEYVASRQQARLAEAYLSWQDTIMPVLQDRTRAGLLLEADRLGFEVAFTSARTTLARNQLRSRLARTTLERLTGRALPELPDTPPAVPLACLQPAVLEQAAEARPAILGASTDVQLRRELLHDGTLAGIDAGVTLAQNLSRDVGGRTGWSTAVGLDVSMPLDIREQRDAEAGRRRTELALAEELLGVRRADDQREIDALVQTVELRRRESLSAADRVTSAMEVWRVARLQAERIAGDPLERALQTRLTLYHAGVELSETELRRWLVELDSLALAPDCAAASVPANASADASARASANGTADLASLDLSRTDATFERLITEFRRPRRLPDDRGPAVSLSTIEQLERQRAAQHPAAAAPDGATSATLPRSICPAAPTGASADATGVAPLRLDWFVWDSTALLAAPQQLGRLPASTGRLWLSFNAAQIGQLDDANQAAVVRAFLEAAQACHLQVELLFGDADAVRPDARERTLATLDKLMALGFSGLALDLERDQLPAEERKQWPEWTLALLRDWHASHPQPLALVTHYRDLVDRSWNERLGSAGVTELVPMIYISNAAAAARQTERVLAAAGRLPVTLAQSIEAALPAEESVHSLGRQAALMRWQALVQILSAGRGVRAIAVQSLEDYLRSTP
ncbi:MAG: TolC family protein [Leptothrix sp. (in: b-proteobacteria)]